MIARLVAWFWRGFRPQPQVDQEDEDAWLRMAARQLTPHERLEAGMTAHRRGLRP